MSSVVELLRGGKMVGVPAERGLFCNRTLNLRSISAIGYDMDYTLVHYRVDVWEERAYAYLRTKLQESGWPVAGLTYQPGLVVRGLVLDLELGNIVKANRFGYIKQAFHGTRRLEFDQLRMAYAGTLVDLADSRWQFLNTFFSLSEACMYAQLVDLLDRKVLSEVLGYRELYSRVRHSLDETHAEGMLKSEIVEDPARYVDLDPDVGLTLLDQLEAGKRLLLITNSEWLFAKEMMKYAFDGHLPGGMTWRDLFEVIIVAARKPDFFSTKSPLFEVVDEDGLLRPCVGGPRRKGIYVGGNAGLVEDYLGLSGSEILYVGDHLYTDVRLSKDLVRWRTALMVRELEAELRELHAFAPKQKKLSRLMIEKEVLEAELSQVRLRIQRLRREYGPEVAEALENKRALDSLRGDKDALRGQISSLDELIAPLAAATNRLFNNNWGLLMRTGRDKSHLARQVERYADVYTSRVSNFLHQTPFVYLRSPMGSLPHDPYTTDQ